MLFNKKKEREEWASTLKIGDKVAIRFGSFGFASWRIYEIVKVTPSGRLNLDNGTVLNPDASIRGNGGYDYAHPVTKEVRRSIWRDKAEAIVSRMNIRTLSDSQLKRIEEILEEGKE